MMTHSRVSPGQAPDPAEAPAPGREGSAVLVSVIVNNYNYAKFLTDAIESALAQTHPRVEVVVVDDGSTDSSREIIAGYGDRIVPVLKANGGQASAFNEGFAAARGEIVFFLDADDVLLPNAVERVVAAWRPGVSKVQFRLQLVDGEGKPIGRMWPPRELSMPSGDLAKEIIERGEYLFSPTSGNAFSRGLLQAILPMPPEPWRLSADVYLVYMAAFHGEVVSLDEALALYRMHGQNYWSYTRPDVARLASQVKIDLQKQEIILEGAKRQSLPASPDLILNSPWHVYLRITLSLMDPRNELETHSLPHLAWKGLGATWRDPHVTRSLKVATTLWLALVPIAPRPVARKLAEWRFYPAERPALLRKLGGLVR